jgi:hypothetical protein
MEDHYGRKQSDSVSRSVQDLKRVRASLSRIICSAATTQPATAQPATGATSCHQRSRPVRTSGMAMTRENSQEPTQSRADTLVTDPMGALYEVTKLRNLRSNNLHGHAYAARPTILEDDFISKGKVSEADAEELFRTFSTSLNHYLWGGIGLVHSIASSHFHSYSTTRTRERAGL